ncbi:MAG: hypothetical protein GX640_12790 [Fibrobacter sp.]|nr:hypothetical protein [Fibrobacter sp.]
MNSRYYSDYHSLIAFSVPLYITYYPFRSLLFSLIPSYSGRIWIGDEDQDLIGLNCNVKTGTKIGTVIEFAVNRDLIYNKNYHFLAGLGVYSVFF